MTERRRTSLERSQRHLAVGSSAMSWDRDRLTIEIAELTVPRLSRVRGRVHLYPSAPTACDLALDTGGRHRWRPIAPRARVEVEMEAPHLRWQGSGYFDNNCGSAPLEDDFKYWTWSRTNIGDDGAAILYDAIRRRGEPLAVALQFDRHGNYENFTPPPEKDMPSTSWRIERRTRSEDGADTKIIKTLEDTPFYARSVIASRLLGERRVSMHESLSLDRFNSRLIQTLLPFRMPRAFQ